MMHANYGMHLDSCGRHLFLCQPDLPLFSEVAVTAHAFDEGGAGSAEPASENGRGI